MLSRAKNHDAEPRPWQKVWGRAKPLRQMVAEAKPRRDRLKNCLEVASSRDSCLEDHISVQMHNTELDRRGKYNASGLQLNSVSNKAVNKDASLLNSISVWSTLVCMRIVYREHVPRTVFMVLSWRSYCEFMWLMQNSTKWLPTLDQPTQLTWAIHHHHLLLLSPRATRMVEGQVNLGGWLHTEMMYLPIDISNY